MFSVVVDCVFFLVLTCLSEYFTVCSISFTKQFLVLELQGHSCLEGLLSNLNGVMLIGFFFRVDAVTSSRTRHYYLMSTDFNNILRYCCFIIVHEIFTVNISTFNKKNYHFHGSIVSM